MTTKKLTMEAEARLSLRAGVDVLADAVKSTLGPAGRQVVLEHSGRSPQITKDGVNVARAIELHGRIEQAAAQIVRQAAQRTADDVGDGSTATTVLAQALVREGMKHLAVGVDASRLKHGIDRAALRALDALAAMAVPCSEHAALLQVATLAANGDEETGQLVADALHRVGKAGLVQVEAGRGLHSTLHLLEGMQWDVGPASPRFATDVAQQRVRLERPLVLVVAGMLDAARELIMLMERAAEASRPLVIVAEDFSADVMNLMVVNARLGTLRLCAVKAPGIGDHRRALLDDLALSVGSRVFDPLVGDKIGTLALSQLGGADRFESNARQTVFVGGRVDAQAIKSHLDQLRRGAVRVAEPQEREGLLARVAMLTGAVAVIRIGAATELELQEKLDRSDDAVHTARAALTEGLVPGGGVAYLRVRPAVAEATVSDPDVAAGIATLAAALQAPFMQILASAGIEALPVLAKVACRDDWEGFDVATGSYGNLQVMGVVEPAAVVRSALRQACSAAGMLLTTECVVTHA